MSGLEASPIAAVGWLAGGAKYNTWLQNDRMPPLSYWAGWVWSRTFGLAEGPMRWLSITCAVVATGLVVAASCRAWGLASGVCSGLLLGLSPNVLDHALEIRAYALFLMESAGALGCLVALLSDPPHRASRWLLPMTLCAVAAIYTHYFGLVLSGACFLAALVLFPCRGGSTRHVLLAIAITGIACTGVLPFVLSSLHGSGNESGAAPKLVFVAQWMYRLYSHPTISLSPLEEGMAALGFAGAAAVALYLAVRDPLESGAAVLGLAIALCAGAVVTLLGLFLLRGMIATKPTYSAWMLPALAMLLSSGLAKKPGRPLWFWYWSLIGILLLLGTYGAALRERVTYGEWFTHAPVRRLTSLINTMGPGRVAVIYEGNRDPMLYFPIYYSFRDGVKQYVLAGQASDKLALDPYPPGVRIDLEDLLAESLIVIRSEEQRSTDLVRQLRDGLKTFSVGPVTRALNRSARWKLTDSESYRAFLGVDIHIFERVSTSPRPDL